MKISSKKLKLKFENSNDMNNDGEGVFRLANRRGLESMDPALLKEREAFKKRSQAIPVVEKKPSVPKDSQGVPPVKPKKKKKKSALSRPKPVRLQTG